MVNVRVRQTLVSCPAFWRHSGISVMCVVSVMKSFIEGLVELAYFALLYDHLVASVMKLAISVIESAFRLHSDSAILSAVSVMIFVNFGSTNNLFPFSSLEFGLIASK